MNLLPSIARPDAKPRSFGKCGKAIQMSSDLRQRLSPHPVSSRRSLGWTVRWRVCLKKRVRAT
jgi:hypothetical protein